MHKELNETNNYNEAAFKNEETITVNQETIVEDPKYSELKELIDKHFSTIESLVRYSKTKDANVLALSNQLQEYRDGFTKNLYKRMALELIQYREECCKSYRETKENISKDDVIKYVKFLSDDLYDLMQGIGITEREESFFYNGKPLDDVVSSIKMKPTDAKIETTLSVEKVANFEDLISYLQNVENVIIETLKNNSILDSIIADYIKISSVYEAGLYQVVLYPTIRKIISLYKTVVQKSESDKELVTEENATTFYRDILEFLISSIEEILFLLDVSVNREPQDVYDAKRNRILKTILTEDTELNGKIAFQYTDCYVMDEKVIYPAKVDVYKGK